MEKLRKQLRRSKRKKLHRKFMRKKTKSLKQTLQAPAEKILFAKILYIIKLIFDIKPQVIEQ